MARAHGGRRRGGTLVVGLTGGIAMGKSTVARLFRAARVPVFDADRAVHALGAPGGAAVAAVGAVAPDAIVAGAVDRARLRALIARSPALLGVLEAIFHPMVRRQREAAVSRARRSRRPVIVLDVPLLFETGADLTCDVVVVVSAPAAVQRARVRRRPGMSEADAARLLARQCPDRDRIARADVVIPTGRGRGDTARRVRRLLKEWRTPAAFHQRVITTAAPHGAMTATQCPVHPGPVA